MYRVLLMSLLTVLVTIYLARFQPSLARSLPKITLVCLLVVATLALGLLLSKPPWFAMLIPLTVTVMVLTIAYNPQFALLMAYSLSVAMTVALDADLSQLLAGKRDKPKPLTVRREKLLPTVVDKQPRLQVAQRSEVQSVGLTSVGSHVGEVCAVGRNGDASAEAGDKHLPG